eukprot:COSAG06_NODE_31135_length_526_cov_1.405152_2_plen_111_part_00
MCTPPPLTAESTESFATRACERWLTICALNCRANGRYLSSWVKAGADGYPPDFAIEPVKAAYAAKLASDDTAYDDLKKMCDGMLAMKDERWSLQTCLVCDPCCVHSCLAA